LLLQLRAAEAEFQNAENELQQIKAQQVVFRKELNCCGVNAGSGAACYRRRKVLAGAAGDAAASRQRSGRGAVPAAAGKRFHRQLYHHHHHHHYHHHHYRRNYRLQTEAANAHLAVLRRSNVLNDCFLIMPGEGSPFNTINGFKIGTAV
jgi:hypothetical protein